MTLPAVNTPVELTVPPPFTTVQVGVNCTTLPDASLPTATNCCGAPTASVAGLGVTVMVATGPTVTITVAVAEMDPLVALMVLAYVPGAPAALNTPLASMDPPPLTTDHVIVVGDSTPPKSLPTAVNCCVAPTASVCGLGVMTSVAGAPGS